MNVWTCLEIIFVSRFIIIITTTTTTLIITTTTTVIISLEDRGRSSLLSCTAYASIFRLFQYGLVLLGSTLLYLSFFSFLFFNKKDT